MERKKLIKIVFYLLSFIAIVVLSFMAYIYYWSKHKYLPSQNKFTKRVAYIDLNKAKFTKGFQICDSTYIVDYYNYAKGDSINRITSYIEGKNGLRKKVLSKYENKNYLDSGYLNFRFIVNCKGDAGAYIVHENDLDLNPKSFNLDLVKQLFDITRSLKKWNPNFMRGKNRDSYMYISYRIENGEITQIIP